MSGVILAYLDQPATAPTLLRVAAHLADLLGGANVHALIVRTPPEATIMPTEEVLTTQQADRIRARESARAADLTAAFEAWRPQANHPAYLAEVEALAGEIIAERGAAAGDWDLCPPWERCMKDICRWCERPGIAAMWWRPRSL